MYWLVGTYKSFVLKFTKNGSHFVVSILRNESVSTIWPQKIALKI